MVTKRRFHDAPRSRDNVAAARDLRQRQTPAEAVLWEALRERRLAGIKMRRQHPVGAYVLDFCCPAVHLGIELDGAVHVDRRTEDADRALVLAEYGYVLLRFPNEAVLNDLPTVLARIRAEVERLGGGPRLVASSADVTVGPHPLAPSPAAAGEGEAAATVGPRPVAPAPAVAGAGELAATVGLHFPILSSAVAQEGGTAATGLDPAEAAGGAPLGAGRGELPSPAAAGEGLGVRADPMETSP